MRIRLFYSLFILFTLLVVSSKLNNEAQPLEDVIAYGQCVDAHKADGCMVLAINYSLKEPIPAFIAFLLSDERLFQIVYDQRIKLLFTQRVFPKTYFRLIKQKFPVPFHFTATTDDDHHLS